MESEKNVIHSVATYVTQDQTDDTQVAEYADLLAKSMISLDYDCLSIMTLCSDGGLSGSTRMIRASIASWSSSGKKYLQSAAHIYLNAHSSARGRTWVS